MNAEVVLDGLILCESPRWHDDRLWVADWAAHELITLDADGTRQVAERPASIPCCIDWLPDGRLLLVSGDRLLRREPDGAMVTHADWAPLDPHPWNDIAVDSQGNVFVGCIGLDLPGGEYAPGIIAVFIPDGVARTAAEDLAFPNGMVVTPDDATLFVAESYGNRLTAFDIGAGGALSNRRVRAGLGEDHPDGICLDARGTVWAADVGSKYCVRVREGGQVLQTVDADRGCFACTLADPADGPFTSSPPHGPTASAHPPARCSPSTSRCPAPGPRLRGDDCARRRPRGRVHRPAARLAAGGLPAASWRTLQTPRSRRPSSVLCGRTSCCKATSARCWRRRIM